MWNWFYSFSICGVICAFPVDSREFPEICAWIGTQVNMNTKCNRQIFLISNRLSKSISNFHCVLSHKNMQPGRQTSLNFRRCNSPKEKKAGERKYATILLDYRLLLSHGQCRRKNLDLTNQIGRLFKKRWYYEVRTIPIRLCLLK